MAGKRKHLNGLNGASLSSDRVSAAKHRKSAFSESSPVVINDDDDYHSDQTEPYSFDTQVNSDLSDDDLMVVAFSPAEQASPSKLQSVKSVHEDAKHITEILQLRNFKAVYDKVMERRKEPDRMNTVLNSILEKGLESFDDAPKVNEQAPTKSTSLTVSSLTEANDDVVATLIRDTKSLSRIFPDVDTNEIYAHLEAHHNKINRLEIVANDLTKRNNQSEDSLADSIISSKRSEEPGVDAEILRDVEIVQGLFPDCDPNYLYEELLGRKSGGDVSAVNSLTAQMFELKNYPKLKDRMELMKKESRKKEIVSLQFDMNDFLEMFPDPKAYFSDEERTLSEGYIRHATVMLSNIFPMLKQGYIKQVMDSHRSHFLPAFREMEKIASRYNAQRFKYASHKQFRHTLREVEVMPEECDELFYRELMYTKREPEILALLQLRKDQRSRRLTAAKENNELFECGCCYDDELLSEDMLVCPDGHLFCSECIRRSSEEILGLAKLHFPCLQAGCGMPFTLATLQRGLKPKTFDLLLRKIQESEIEQACLDDLVKCPFCTFATIMPNPDDKVLCCKNPECLRESCRLCQEPNHVPLRCEEVERQGETDMRTFIEMRVSEAMLRTCLQCKKRFYKTEGCNKMTCSCGASMCYVCRKPIKDYSHFGEGKDQCPQSSNEAALHQKEMEKALEEAKKKYQTEHPEVEGLQLKYDPEKIIAKAEAQNSQLPGIPIYIPFIGDPYEGEDSDRETDYGDESDNSDDGYGYF